MTEQIVSSDIVSEMRDSYLEYAMSVIVGRALPDVRDGLKPVHRRILYAMHDQGNEHNKPYRKSARVVGDVIGKYHPHGDSAVYDAIVRMTQDFSMRIPLVDGQGNFGSVDGDAAAAMRYTEIRMEKITKDLLADLEKETVDFSPNYDGSLQEPTVLPSRIPNLLLNGSTGIAVGMASNIPPHNLAEVMTALIAYIDHEQMTLPQLMEYLPGPDFPTGGMIMGKQGIYEAYQKGRGIISIRAKSHFEKDKNGRDCIIITELPYMVNKALLLEKIANLVREKRLEGISDLRDESDRKGMRIYIQLKRDEHPEVVLTNLFKHTALQSSFGIIMLAIVDQQPKILPILQVFQLFIQHRIEVITRRTKFELKQAQAKAHILEGLTIALDDLDAVIEKIKTAENGGQAKERLIQEYGLSKEQAQAILEMKLQRLTGLEQEKIRKELAVIQELIEKLTAILNEKALVKKIIRDEFTEIVEQYGDPRRTSIEETDSTIDIEDLIKQEDMVVTISHEGYIKRCAVAEFRTQRKGGSGRLGMSTKDEDFVEEIMVASTHDFMLIFTTEGRIFSKKIYQIPLALPTSRGKAVINLLPLGENEKICAYLNVPQDATETKYITMCTRYGICKKIHLLDCSKIRSSGIRGITLKEGDRLISAQLSMGEQDLFFATRQGQSLRVHESKIRAMGRTAQGVIGIRLNAGDEVVSMEILSETQRILTVTENGYGKTTHVDSYPLSQNRGNKGVRNIQTSERNGFVVGSIAVDQSFQLLMITQKGKLIRIATDKIPTIGRNTQGVRLIRLKEDEKVIGIATVFSTEEEELDPSDALEETTEESLAND